MIADRRQRRKSRLRRYLGRKHRPHLPPGFEQTDDLASMSPAMVDRLFWRAGFGPTAEDRATWTGRSVADAVEWLLTTPAEAVGAPAVRDGQPLDPKADDTELVLSWVDKMVRARNPFVERLTFFWHRHWANSREEVSPPQLLLGQNELFRSFSGFGAKPNATFKEMAYAVTEDPAMLRYLTGESNVRGAPNENYARELMELFCLGVVNASGQPNYSEDDVKQLSKALSGWQVDDGNPDAPRAYFTTARWFDGPKAVFGKLGNYKDREAVDVVMAHPNHAPYFVTKLWHEFIVEPPDAATLADITSSYIASGYKLKPLVVKILVRKQLFESLGEPNMIKPPVVYVVGAMRALGRSITDATSADYLSAMGQRPYFPPTVAGWEGGLSWLNTNTALARFDFVGKLLSVPNVPGLEDAVGETAAAAYERAYAAVGLPWLAAPTQAAIRDYAGRAPAANAAQRKQRQIVLRALMLAGPDAQVM